MRPDAERLRQIFRFFLPGDVIGPSRHTRGAAPYHIIALTALQTVNAPSHCERLVDAIECVERADQYLLYNHIVRIAARDAYVGLADLFLELYGRLEAVGLAKEGELPMPIGQRVLAQAMGLSVAHTNHTMQRLVASGLIAARRNSIHLLQREEMARLTSLKTGRPNASARALAPTKMQYSAEKSPLHRTGAPAI